MKYGSWQQIFYALEPKGDFKGKKYSRQNRGNDNCLHGREQLTYKGWPVYYFGQDTGKGDNKGVSVPVPGKWPIINADTGAAPL